MLRLLIISLASLLNLSSMLAAVAAKAVAQQSPSFSSSSFNSNALPKSKNLGASMGFWIGLAEFMLGFVALYIGVFLLPRFVNLMVAARRSYKEGFLQIRAGEDGTYELVETIIHTLSTTVPSPAGKHSSINETNLLHKEDYAQHHGSARTSFDSYIEGQVSPEAAGQSGLDDHEAAGPTGPTGGKAEKGRGEQH